MGILSSIGSSLFSVVPGIVGTALGGPIGGTIGTALGAGISGAISNEQSMADQKEYAKYQSELEQANWEKRFNMQNEYNDPSAMRARLENAGMNPNLAYGSLSPNMAANPSAGTPTGQLSKYMTAFEQSIQAKQLELAERSAEADIKLKEAQGKLAENQAENVEVDTEWKWDSYGARLTSVHRQNDDYLENIYTKRFQREMDKLRYALDSFKVFSDVQLGLGNLANEMQRTGIQYMDACTRSREVAGKLLLWKEERALISAQREGVYLDNSVKRLPLLYGVLKDISDGNIVEHGIPATQAQEWINQYFSDSGGQAQFIPYALIDIENQIENTGQDINNKTWHNSWLGRSLDYLTNAFGGSVGVVKTVK